MNYAMAWVNDKLSLLQFDLGWMCLMLKKEEICYYSFVAEVPQIKRNPDKEWQKSWQTFGSLRFDSLLYKGLL